MRSAEINNEMIYQINQIIEDGYAYIKSHSDQNTENIKAVVAEAIRLKNEMVERVGNAIIEYNSFNAENFVINKKDLTSQVYDTYARVIGF